MTEGGSAVDAAMEEERPPKVSMRSLWVDEIFRAQDAVIDLDLPIYLTLPGRDGKDIDKLIEAGIISRTEAGAIAADDEAKVVAVERNNMKVLALQQKFPGLNILEMDFEKLVQGVGLLDWPEGEHREYCRAAVVNLDLNGPLKARLMEGHPVFPVIQWVRKLCLIHGDGPRNPWSLLLTLNGSCVWDENEVDEWISSFLHGNALEEPRFRDGLRRFLGEELFDNIASDHDVIFGGLTMEQQRRIVMVLVPKTIGQLVGLEGWRIEVDKVLGYGGDGTAPMASWIIRFIPDPEAAAIQAAVYRETLAQIVNGICKLDDDGNLGPYVEEE